MSEFKSVWGKLSAIDCTPYIETKKIVKNGRVVATLSYLSWAWAWGILMEHYPDSSFHFDYFTDENDVRRDVMIYSDETCAVQCTITINGCTRSMWLPVMDHSNNAVPSPTSREISDTKMRCLVKCLALFGLGHYIYAGEDVPRTPDEEQPEQKDGKPVEQSEEEAEAQMEKFLKKLGADLKKTASVAELTKLWTDNSTKIQHVRKRSEEAYHEVVAAFNAHKTSIIEGEST